MDSARRVRIGELSRRVGVRPETLRAWERRYGLLEPDRSSGGYRLYSPLDEARVRAMTALLADGVSAAEAATLARDTPKGGGGIFVPAAADRPLLADRVGQLLTALAAFDEVEANAILDDALARFSLDAALAGLVLPGLTEIGDRWEREELSIAQEHFATELLRGRLLGAARGWGGGGGPLALLACPPEERHDLGLIAFGLSLRGHGWRIAFLGVDTPASTLLETAERLDPAVVVIAAIEPRRFEETLRELRRLAEYHAVLIAGAGANPKLARSLGAAHLGGDPIEAARWVAEAPERA